MHRFTSSRQHSLPGFYCPSARRETPFINFLHFRQNAQPIQFTFRLKNSKTLVLRQKLLPAYAAKTNPSGGSDETNSDTAQGPPFLTILAGFLVFSVICWIIGSIIMWLIGLFIHAPPSK